MSKRGLKERILKEMTVNDVDVLVENFELSKKFVRLTPDGKVSVLFKDKLTGKERILLYLIGKLYAKQAEYTSTDDVGNKELQDGLGIPSGSLLPWLKSLRDSKKIVTVRRGRYTHHAIPASQLARVLESLDAKMKRLKQ